MRDLLSPVRPEKPAPIIDPSSSSSRKEKLQVFQKGSQVTTLVGNISGLGARSPGNLRQDLSTPIGRQSDSESRRLNDKRDGSREVDKTDGGSCLLQQKSRSNREKMGFSLTRSTASLDFKSQSHRRRSSRFDTTIDNFNCKNNRKSTNCLQSLEFDSEPNYYRIQVNQFFISL